MPNTRIAIPGLLLTLVLRMTAVATYRMRQHMENTTNILTVRDVAQIFRVSRAHVHNVLIGKVAGVPKLTHLRLGRRRQVRREWLDQWLEASKTR